MAFANRQRARCAIGYVPKLSFTVAVKRTYR